jgi:hypothetical protein
VSEIDTAAKGYIPAASMPDERPHFGSMAFKEKIVLLPIYLW